MVLCDSLQCWLEAHLSPWSGFHFGHQLCSIKDQLPHISHLKPCLLCYIFVDNNFLIAHNCRCSDRPPCHLCAQRKSCICLGRRKYLNWSRGKLLIWEFFLSHQTGSRWSSCMFLDQTECLYFLVEKSQLLL